MIPEFTNLQTCSPCSETCFHCTHTESCQICRLARSYFEVPPDVMEKVTRLRNESIDECKPTVTPAPTVDTTTGDAQPLDLSGDLNSPPAPADSPSGDTPRAKRAADAPETATRPKKPHCVPTGCESTHFLWLAPRNRSCCTGNRTMHNGYKESLDCRLEDDLCLPCDEACLGGCSWFGADNCFQCKVARLFTSNSDQKVSHMIFFGFNCL